MLIGNLFSYQPSPHTGGFHPARLGGREELRGVLFLQGPWACTRLGTVDQSDGGLLCRTTATLGAGMGGGRDALAL